MGRRAKLLDNIHTGFHISYRLLILDNIHSGARVFVALRSATLETDINLTTETDETVKELLSDFMGEQHKN